MFDEKQQIFEIKKLVKTMADLPDEKLANEVVFLW